MGICGKKGEVGMSVTAMKEDVKFICPLCGKEWVEEQDTNDEWFRLATMQTLCEECSKKAIRKNLAQLKDGCNKEGR